MTRGLRVRLIATLIAAALVPMAPVSIALLLQVRDALYARRAADARETLRHVRSVCEQKPPLCVVEQGATPREGPCTRPSRREGQHLFVCEPFNGASIELGVDLGPVREQIAALDLRMLLLLAISAAAVVVIGASLLERGVVRRLARIDETLEAVGAENEAELLPEGGDAVGRVGAAVNRLSVRLREERQRTRAQIGELEKANREIRAAREEVARSERLASVGRLAAGVAHEVGNPVSALIGYAALMRDRLAAGQDVSEYVGRVEREAARIDRILRDLLDLARPRETRLVAVDPRHALAQAPATLPVEAGELPKVLGEEHYVVQIFVNLLANAARAGATKVRVSGRGEGEHVVVELADDGRGIPPDALPRLFEPFFTTAAPGQGTGLGLALCHATMERFGGSIAARNGDKGAVFTLTFRKP